MLAIIAPKVFREVLSSQVRIEDEAGRVMQFKLSEADLWVRRLTEETQVSLRSAVEKSVAEAVDGDAAYLFPYVSLKTLAHGNASAVLESLVSPNQARRLSDLTIGEFIDTYDVPTAVKLTAWLQGTKGPDIGVEGLKELLGLEPPRAEPENNRQGKAEALALPEARPPQDEVSVSLSEATSSKSADGAAPPTTARQRKPRSINTVKSSKIAVEPEAQIQLELPKAEEPQPAPLFDAAPSAPEENIVAPAPESLPMGTEGRPSVQGARQEGLAAPATSHGEQGQAQAEDTKGITRAAAEQPQPHATRRRQRKPVTTEPTDLNGQAAAWLAVSPVIEKLDFEARLKALGHAITDETYREHALDEEDSSVAQTDWVYLELSGRQLVCLPTVGGELKRIYNRCIRHIEVAGAASINIAVTKESAIPKEAANLKTMALAELEKIDGFTWLDKNNGWFYIKRHKSRVIKTILKIMAACRKLPLDELMAGVYRSKTGLGPPVSKDVFRMICKHTAGLQVYKDDVVGAKRGWCKPESLLSEVDQKLVRLFQGKRKVITYQALVQHFTDRGATTATALASPELHPLLKKVAPMLYTLRGRTVEINPW